LLDGEIPIPGPRPPWRRWRWRPTKAVRERPSRPDRGDRHIGFMPAATPPFGPVPAEAEASAPGPADGKRRLDIVQ
jgi:hypothetical protein